MPTLKEALGTVSLRDLMVDRLGRVVIRNQQVLDAVKSRLPVADGGSVAFLDDCSCTKNIQC